MASISMREPVDSGRSADRERYTRVAMWLHWLIAFFIIFNLVLGHVMDPFKGPERYYIMTVHQSVGMTVLALTAARVIWRLMNPPPPYPAGMHSWEKHAAAFTHFLLYAMMVLMPLSGWFMISANPPAGSAGQQALVEMVTGKFGMRGFAPKAGEPPAPVVAPAPGTGSRTDVPPPGPPPKGLPPKLRPKPKEIKVWFLVPLEPIGVLQQLGQTADGWRAQNVLHKDLVLWHKRFGWLTVALLVLHIVGALKHQYMDRQRSLQRMGVGA